MCLITDILTLGNNIMASLKHRDIPNASRINREIKEVFEACKKIEMAIQPFPFSSISSSGIEVVVLYPQAVDHALYHIARKSIKQRKIESRVEEV